MNALPNDCLYLIFSQVTIAIFEDGVSKLGDLNKCGSCEYLKLNCKHLTVSEVIGIKYLKFVCKKWRECVSNRFHFKDGPYYTLPPN